MQIIGLSGQAQNGKDEISNYLAKKLGFNRTAFATAVKSVFCDSFDVDMDFVEEWKVKSECPPNMQMPVRKALQFIGDGFRQIRSDIWLEIAFRKMKDRSVISDARYFNELARIKNHGGVNILVWRPGFENNDPNPSEALIRSVIDEFRDKNVAEGAVSPQILEQDSPAYAGAVHIDLFLINNGMLSDLYEKSDRLVLPYLRDVMGWDV